MATIADLIRASAAKHGIDPEVALRVYGSEGRSGYAGDLDATGTPTSFGPFQLHYKGQGNGMGGPGLGDAFTAATHLDARNQDTIPQQIDFALQNAKKGGWTPWHGAAKVGIGPRDGLDGSSLIGTGSIKPTPGQFNGAPGANLDPQAAGVGSIGASFAGGTAPISMAPAAESQPAAAPDPVLVAPSNLGSIFSQAIGQLAPAPAKPKSMAPLQSGVTSAPLDARLPRATAPLLA